MSNRLKANEAEINFANNTTKLNIMQALKAICKSQKGEWNEMDVGNRGGNVGNRGGNVGNRGGNVGNQGIELK